jgi:hypothetical protein
MVKLNTGVKIASLLQIAQTEMNKFMLGRALVTAHSPMPNENKNEGDDSDDDGGDWGSNRAVCSTELSYEIPA